jgi:hypothetical protein
MLAECWLRREMKPGAIQQQYPELFGNVTEIYRAKRNLLERLQRDPTIRRFL